MKTKLNIKTQEDKVIISQDATYSLEEFSQLVQSYKMQIEFNTKSIEQIDKTISQYEKEKIAHNNSIETMKSKIADIEEFCNKTGIKLIETKEE